MFHTQKGFTMFRKTLTTALIIAVIAATIAITPVAKAAGVCTITTKSGKAYITLNSKPKGDYVAVYKKAKGQSAVYWGRVSTVGSTYELGSTSFTWWGVVQATNAAAC